MRSGLKEFLEDAGIQAIVCNGGTGLSARDNSIEVVRPMLVKELEGFGELFRLLSFQQIGAAAIMSRATAGIIDKTAVFCLPGSTKAVRLAMHRIIIPQLAHLVWEANR
jgi:molybdenum cofactor biosynthesis protein B